jgi:hypothetical protein
MKRSTAIFAFLLISGPVGATIEPGHQVVVAGKLAPLEPAPLENVAVLLRDNKDKAELPLQCRGYYLRRHKARDFSRCN